MTTTTRDLRNEEPKPAQTLSIYINIYSGNCTTASRGRAALFLRVLEIFDDLVVVALLLRACVHRERERESE